MRLRKIPIDFLWEGLELSGDIYNDRGSVLLLKRGEVLTQDRLDKLSKFERGGYITTSEETYQEILNSGKAPRAALQRVYEEAVGYTALKNDVDSIFSVTRNASEINMEATETVTKDIFTKIKVLDFPKIFQCIDAPRDMDENLQRHSLNVAFTNGVIGQWLKLPEPVIKKLVCAGLVHDIGKTKIPEEILNAPRRLTEEEFEIIKAHPVYSYELLWDNVDEDIRLAARHHHERLDGKGYPDQIAGDEISLLARITAISDVYDAMISQRSYKESMIPFDVLEKFKKGEFPGLDERLVDLFVKNMVENYRDVKVQMSDGRIGVVRYIPPNDLNHPIINCNHDVRQTDDKWYCVCIANQTGK